MVQKDFVFGWVLIGAFIMQTAYLISRWHGGVDCRVIFGISTFQY